MGETHAQFAVVRIGQDEEVNGRIYLQFSCLKDALDLADERKGAIVTHLMNGMSKLAAVNYHYSNYVRREDTRIESLRKQVRKSKRPPETLTEEAELVFELEAFLLQTKSSLDMLVKILSPLLDLSEGSLHLSITHKFSLTEFTSATGSLALASGASTARMTSWW